MTKHVEVMDLVAQLKAAEEAFVLATVVRTVSVTAAKAGAKAIIRPDGTIVAGWIGGGCARGAVLKAARDALADGEPRMVSVQPENLLAELGVKPGENRDGVRFAENMCPSKGTMDVFVEPVLPHPSLVILGASPVALSRIQTGVTKAIINSHAQPTAAFIFKPDIDFETGKIVQAIRTAVGDGGADSIDATGLTAALMGDSIAANLFMLGHAIQKGLLPLTLAAIERAIELNGVAIDANKRSFAWGRLAAHDRVQVETLVRGALRDDAAPEPQGLDALVEHRAAFLKSYQNADYAQRYRNAVRTIRVAEAKLARGFSGLAEAVARNLFTLMAYKDEYEVARLYSDTSFVERVKSSFDGDNLRLEFHLAPPLLARRDAVTGEPKKMSFGPWLLDVFRVLAKFKFLRGTSFDPFGYTAERRTERRLVAEYEDVLGEIIEHLTPDNHHVAVELASIPEKIRGFGHVKQRHLTAAKAEEAELREQFGAGAAPFLKAAE